MEKKRNKIFIFPMLLLALLLGNSCGKGNEEAGNTGLINRIKDYTGYTRVVGQEEYDFYAYFVNREETGDVSLEELEKRTREYGNKVNAIFYLANRLGLHEPYSFELLKLRMEEENSSRRLRLEKGEAIYGLSQFTLQSYFQYKLDNLEMKIKAFIEEYADDEIMARAEEYYYTNSESFHRREAVTYEISMGKEKETVTADKQKLDFMGKSDKGLGDFLETAEPGDTYEDIKNQENRKILLKEIQYSKEGFAYHQEAALYAYIEKELYPFLIETVAQNNSVEFGLN